MIQTLRRQNLEIAMDIETEFERHRFQTFFTKEPETIDWIKTFLKPGEIFFDIGANVGVFSLYAAALLRDKIKVYAFEPVYHNFNKLCRNIIANNFASSVFPYAVAISDQTRFETMSLASTVSGSASHLMQGAPSYLSKNFKAEFQQGIFCVTLDELTGKYLFPVPNHLKIDVDGFEERVLAGGSRVLKNSRLRSALIEITNQAGVKDRILKVMAAAGFSTSHRLNTQKNHSRVRREQSGKGYIENIIFTKL